MRQTFVNFEMEVCKFLSVFVLEKLQDLEIEEMCTVLVFGILVEVRLVSGLNCGAIVWDESLSTNPYRRIPIDESLSTNPYLLLFPLS